MLSGWFAVVLAEANMHTWYPGGASTFVAFAESLQVLLEPEEPVVLLLALLLLLEHAAPTSTSAAAPATDVVSLAIFLTRSPPF
jgi:hypothetical protein